MSIVKIVGKTILLLICSVIQTIVVLFMGLSRLLEKISEYLDKLCEKMLRVAETGLIKKKTPEIENTTVS